MLLLSLTIVVGASAFTSNDIDGGVSVGSQIKLANTGSESAIVGISDKMVMPEFNLNADVMAIVQVPTCGSGGNRGWTVANTQVVNGENVYYEKRTCLEVVRIPTPYGTISFTYETYEVREMPKDQY